MPIYDFKCQSCSRIFESLVRETGKAVCCPNCGSQEVKRLISASYLVKTESRASGVTCCGRTERCDTPPCSTDEGCHRH